MGLCHVINVTSSNHAVHCSNYKTLVMILESLMLQIATKRGSDMDVQILGGRFFSSVTSVHVHQRAAYTCFKCYISRASDVVFERGNFLMAEELKHEFDKWVWKTDTAHT